MDLFATGIKSIDGASKIQGGPFADYDFAHEFGKWGQKMSKVGNLILSWA